MRIPFLSAALLMWLAWPANTYANPQKEALEQFDLKSLEYFSIDYGNGTCGPVAYVMDPNGYLYLVRVGSFIGKNHGRVAAITVKELRIVETREDGNGEWKEVSALLQNMHEK